MPAQVIAPNRYDSDTPEYLRVTRTIWRSLYTADAACARQGKGKAATLMRTAGGDILAMRHAGMSYDKISRAYKVSAETIRAVLRDAGEAI